MKTVKIKNTVKIFKLERDYKMMRNAKKLKHLITQQSETALERRRRGSRRLLLCVDEWARGSSRLVNSAFTLAEVLITLGVIGVVAAVTMPGIMRGINNQVTVSKLKKEYAKISEMATNIKLKTGCDNLDCTGLTDDFSLDKFVEYAGLKDAKVYETNWNRAQYLYCEQQKSSCDNNTGHAFKETIITKDNIGYVVSVIYRNRYSSNETVPKRNFISIAVITNNAKKAIAGSGALFKTGRDYFIGFCITDDFRVEPCVTGFGSSTWTLSEAQNNIHHYINPEYIKKGCDPISGFNNSNSGSNCVARIMLAGWKIDY